MTTHPDWKAELTCAVSCRDLDKSIRWYEDVLGFKVIYRLDDMGWCEIQTCVPGVSIGLSQVETPATGGGATLTFGVKDIDAARAALEAKDVRFDGPTREIEGMVKLATFFDPDDNALMLAQGLAEGG